MLLLDELTQCRRWWQWRRWRRRWQAPLRQAARGQHNARSGGGCLRGAHTSSPADLQPSRGPTCSPAEQCGDLGWRSTALRRRRRRWEPNATGHGAHSDRTPALAGHFPSPTTTALPTQVLQASHASHAFESRLACACPQDACRLRLALAVLHKTNSLCKARSEKTSSQFRQACRSCSPSFFHCVRPAILAPDLGETGEWRRSRACTERGGVRLHWPARAFLRAVRR